MKKVILFVVLGLVACAHQKPAPEVTQEPKTVQTLKPTQEARFAGNQNDAAFMAEVVFSKGSKVLTTEAQKSIEEAIQRSKSAGSVKEIKIISWADEEYPSVHTKKLSDQEQNLAQDRAKAIKSILNAGDAKVEILNMARRPTALSSFWQTSDAKIKKSLEVAGIPNTDTAVKSPAKAGHSIIMVILKE